MHTRIDVTAVTISATMGVTPNTLRNFFCVAQLITGSLLGSFVLKSHLRRTRLSDLRPDMPQGAEEILSDHTHALRRYLYIWGLLGGLVDAGPVDTKVGYNTLCLALNQLKFADSGQLLSGED